MFVSARFGSALLTRLHVTPNDKRIAKFLVDEQMTKLTTKSHLQLRLFHAKVARQRDGTEPKCEHAKKKNVLSPSFCIERHKEMQTTSEREMVTNEKFLWLSVRI